MTLSILEVIGNLYKKMRQQHVRIGIKDGGRKFDSPSITIKSTFYYGVWIKNKPHQRVSTRVQQDELRRRGTASVTVSM